MLLLLYFVSVILSRDAKTGVSERPARSEFCKKDSLSALCALFVALTSGETRLVSLLRLAKAYYCCDLSQVTAAVRLRRLTFQVDDLLINRHQRVETLSRSDAAGFVSGLSAAQEK